MKKDLGKKSSLGLVDKSAYLNINELPGQTNYEEMMMDFRLNARPSITCSMEFTWYPFDSQVTSNYTHCDNY